MAVDPLKDQAPDITPYHYTHNNPILRIDKDGLSDLRYNRPTNTIMLTSSHGDVIGVWEANNNTIANADPFPLGTHDFSWYNPHEGLDENSSYGSNGNFIFEVENHTGMGVHAGRATGEDGHGNTGVDFVTEGCIRTTDEATGSIRDTHQGGDPLETLEVVDEPLPTEPAAIDHIQPMEINFN